MDKDYSKTLNLPNTKFPMKANLAEKEPTILETWEKIDIYKKSLEKNEGHQKYILHDGPPFANGDIHLGHTLNKVLKDIIIKYKSLLGYQTPYVPGWDTHGLPIEQQAIKKLGINRHEVSQVEFRKVCKDFAMQYINKQREQFKRLGVKGDWDNPYITLIPEFESKQIEIFGEMAKSKYIYKGLKPVYWCPSCETALAEAEIEYQDVKNTSIYVKFPVKESNGAIKNANLDKTYFIIWTTTTWTLPANVAICLNEQFEYAVVKNGEEYYVVAKELADSVMSANNVENYEIVETIKGKDLEGIKCQHPFIDRDSVVILGDHVTLDAGTGCVHTAPGHGEEDFMVGMKYKLPAISPIDNKGVLTEEAGMFAGLFYKKANPAIYEYLEQNGYLFGAKEIEHSYAHCWRCKHPIIYRATEQWFASIDGFREKALSELNNVEFVPSWGKDRMINMIKDRHDWCVSRQRVWGVPIPIFYCSECGKELINDATIQKIKEIFKEQGSDAWYALSPEELLPEGTKCACGNHTFVKETDIMDVWFDSGSSHAGVLETREELSSPADLYLEGNDQYRGWFQSSLLTSVAGRGKAPYKAVLTHGFVVDGQGKKMSKSLGNGINPQDIIKQYGADVLRLWCVSADYMSDMRISKEILKQLSEAYRKIRNTARYILGNISDFNPNTDSVAVENLLELDKWAVIKLNELIKNVNEAYEKFQFNSVYHMIHNFCVVDMSSFYLDVTKDRLYTSLPSSIERRSGQTAMYMVLNALVKMLSPILTFTTEEIWGCMEHLDSEKVESVQLANWPEISDKVSDKAIEEKWDKILALKEDVAKSLEMARTAKVIGHSLNAKVTLYNENMQEFLKEVQSDLLTAFIVSGVEISDKSLENANIGENTKSQIVVTLAEGEKCERCWMYSTHVGKEADHPTLCKRCADVVNQIEE
jgi:isoleucyl-tRNA synthetase